MAEERKFRSQSQSRTFHFQTYSTRRIRFFVVSRSTLVLIHKVVIHCTNRSRGEDKLIIEDHEKIA